MHRHSWTHVYTYARTCTCTYMHKNTYTPLHTHTVRTHKQVHIHAHRHRQTHTYQHKYMRSRTHRQTRADFDFLFVCLFFLSLKKTHNPYPLTVSQAYPDKQHLQSKQWKQCLPWLTRWLLHMQVWETVFPAWTNDDSVNVDLLTRWSDSHAHLMNGVWGLAGVLTVTYLHCEMLLVQTWWTLL